MVWGRSSDHKMHFVSSLPLPQSNYNMAHGHHLENRFDVIFPQWKFQSGRNSAPGCRMTHRLRRNGRDWNRKQNSNMADVCFFKTVSSYLCLSADEIWFADRLWSSDGSDVNKYETGSSMDQPWPPCWKIDMTSYFRSGCSNLDEIR